MFLQFQDSDCQTDDNFRQIDNVRDSTKQRILNHPCIYKPYSARHNSIEYIYHTVLDMFVAK